MGGFNLIMSLKQILLIELKIKRLNDIIGGAAARLKKKII